MTDSSAATQSDVRSFVALTLHPAESRERGVLPLEADGMEAAPATSVGSEEP